MALNITLQLQVARAPPAACFCSSAIAQGFGKPQGPGWQEPPASSCSDQRLVWGVVQSLPKGLVPGQHWGSTWAVSWWGSVPPVWPGRSGWGLLQVAGRSLMMETLVLTADFNHPRVYRKHSTVRYRHCRRSEAIQKPEKHPCLQINIITSKDSKTHKHVNHKSGFLELFLHY